MGKRKIKKGKKEKEIEEKRKTEKEGRIERWHETIKAMKGSGEGRRSRCEKENKETQEKREDS